MRLVYLAFGWTAGCLIGLGSDHFVPSLWLVLAGVLSLLTFAAWQDPRYRFANIACVCFALGGLRASIVPSTSELAAYNNTGGLTIEGQVIAAPDVRDDRVQLRVTTHRLRSGILDRPISGSVLIYAPPTASVRYGDRILATGDLIIPAEFDTFSYADYLARDGIFSIMPNAAVEVLSSGHGSALYTALYDLRDAANLRIARFLPEPQAGLLAGILLGNERGIAPEIQEAFNKVGAAHVVAISGFNMAVVSGLVIAWLSRITTRRWVLIGFGVGIIMLYTLLVGASAAVVRAAIMSSLLVIGKALRRSTYVPASLAFVALLMSLDNPAVLYDIGFQLSFFATLGLSLFTTPLNNGLSHLLRRFLPPATAAPLGTFLGEPLVVSVAALITTLPLTILYFQRLSLVVLLVNLLIVPVQAWLLIIGIMATWLAFVLPTVAQLVYWLDMLLLSWTINVVRFFAALPFAEVAFTLPDEVIYLYFVLLIGWTVMHATQPTLWLRLGAFIRQRLVLSSILFCGGGIAVLMGAVALSRPDGRLHVWFLDMGHSNAVLAQTPGGAHLLIDGGRFPSRLLTALGDRLPFTDRQIEVVIATQPDEFDISALARVLDRYSAGVILTNGQTSQLPAIISVQEQLSRYPLVTVTHGYSVTFDDGTRLEILHPPLIPALTDDIDANALVIRLSYGEISFLIGGDINAEGQAALLDNGAWPLATVLHLPQHGTARSLNAGFYQAAQPQLVVIQTDRANRRGDPDPDILARLGDIPLLRTDQQGTIHLLTDGVHLYHMRR